MWPYNYKNWNVPTIAGALLYLADNGHLGHGLEADNILSNMADFARKKHFLTRKQADFIKGKISAYLEYLPRNMKDVPVFVMDFQGDIGHIAMLNPKTIQIFCKRKNAPALVIAQAMPGFADHGDFYTVPFSKRNCHILLNNGLAMGRRIQQFLDVPERIELDADLSGLKMNLKEYQKQGVAFLISRKGNALLADEQGLGKTAQAIAWGELSGMKQICVVCPASLKANWRKEIIQWTGNKSIVILSGKKPDKEIIREMKKAKWIIINYEILVDWGDALEKLRIPAWLYDEAQALKNVDSLRTRAAVLLSQGKKVILLSGTPIENRPAEFLPLIGLIEPHLFPNKLRFYERYCDLKRNNFGKMEYSGANNIPELYRILCDTVMIRRKKSDVLNELPEKTRAVIPVVLSDAEMREYASIEANFTDWVQSVQIMDKDFRVQAANQLEALKLFAANAKLAAVYNWIDLYLESEPKLVVFAHHKAIIAELKKRYSKCCVVIDGSTDSSKRQDIVENFQNNPKIKLFIGNIKAAGTGITLTAAKDTLTIELAWTSTAHDQCEDRVHRYGQKNAVTAYYLIAEGTIEERIAKIIDDKRNIITQALDGKEVENTDLLDELLRQYRGE